MMLAFDYSDYVFYDALDCSDKINFLDLAFKKDNVEQGRLEINKEFGFDILPFFSVGDSILLQISVFKTFYDELGGVIIITNKNTNRVHYAVTASKLTIIKDFLLTRFEHGDILSSNTKNEAFLKKYKKNMKFLNKRYVRWFDKLNDDLDFICYN